MGPDAGHIVPGLLVEQTIGAIYGPSQVLKSFLDLALSLAHGREWCGHRLARMPVAHVAAEGRSGVGVRIAAWERRHGIEGDGLFRLVPVPVNLSSPQDVADLIRDLDYVARAGFGQPFGLVVFDTLARCSVGVEENSAKETGVVIDHLSAIRTAFGCAVVGVHHTGKNVERGMRGSYRFFADLDTVVEVERRDGTLDISATVRKQKDGEDNTEMLFTAAKERWWHDRHGMQDSLVILPRNADADDARLTGLQSSIAAGMPLGKPVSRS